jgi:hypothetical protein
MIVIDAYVAITAHFSTMLYMVTSVVWCIYTSNVRGFSIPAQWGKLINHQCPQVNKI